MPGTTLADWLRSLDDEALAALLRARPDITMPPPADSTVLATRAGVAASVARAMEDLDRFTLTTLTALVVAGADREPVARKEVTRLLGPRIPARRITSALAELRRRALAWGPDDAIALVPSARQVTGPHPGGLGRAFADLDGVDIDAVLAELADDELRVLHALAAGPPVGATRDAAEPVAGPVTVERARTPVQRLLARGLLRRVDPSTVELPAQVALALRGDRPLGPVELDEPELPTRPPDPSTVDSTTAGAVLELLRHAEDLLAAWSQDPPAVLRSGGLGVRDLRRTARRLDTAESTVVVLAELAAAAGLLTSVDEETGAIWLPTVAADTWLAAAPEQRWATLASAWLDLPRTPGLAGSRDEKDRLLAPLSEELRRPLAPRQRRTVLEALAALPEGAGIKQTGDLAAVLAWRAPRRAGRLRDELVEWTVQEATALGVVALGALSGPGRALLGGDASAAAAALRATLPEPVDHVLVQADRTLVAPGPLESGLASEIGLIADVESAGGATVYRITEDTVRRALDAGRSAADLHELLETRSRTPVPQSLSYLIEDVARRHGRLRAGAAASFLRCDDEATLTELMAHPVAIRAGLRRLARTVVVSELALSELLEEVRSAGFAPVAEDGAGQIIDLRAGVRRAQPRKPPRRPSAPPELTDDQVRALVRGIQAGDATATVTDGLRPGATNGGATAADTVRLLQGAAHAGHSVWIFYVDSHGVANRRIVQPVSVGGGVLEGFDRSHGEVRRFPLHRIMSAAVVSD